MRILIIVHNLTGGGAQRVASLWTKGFVNRGHEVGLVLDCPKDTHQTYHVPMCVKQYNVHCWLANKLFRVWNIDFVYVLKLRGIVSDFKPDVIICVLGNWAERARKATKGKGIPIINTEHNSFERPNDAPLPKEIWQRKFKLNKLYHHVTVLTEADKKCINEYQEKVSVLPNPLAFDVAQSVPTKERIILAAGRLDAWHVKGFDLLIKAWGKIAKSFPEWKLQIAGHDKNNALAFLQSLAKEEDLCNQLEFLGYQENMLPIYQRSSIFVLSSRYEGFGMVLIEAMSQGCAPIACDYKGRQQEIITSPDEGLICPVDDVDTLANAIGKMIEDTDYREKAQKNAIKRSQYYKLDHIMNRWDTIINSIKV